MLRPADRPFASGDVTGAVRQNFADTEPRYWQMVLWPFSLTVATLKSGSRNFLLEFRPLMKFSVTLGFFWKV